MDILDDHVAPLNVLKGKVHAPSQNEPLPHGIISSNMFSTLPSQMRVTPPLTPHSSLEDIVERSSHEISIFHNYLRAFYPFKPNAGVSSSTVTLPLDQGDIILVHSIHTNGWADGTLLETGARGWLPTNYCEAYDQVPMRPLLKSLTDFWDTIRGGSASTLHQFTNQDYMRGLIAGVRFLLEKSECLTRDCHLVQKFDALRRNRKALLSDLSSLVKLAKRLQDVATGGQFDGSLDAIFDQMLFKAFKIITRGVRFLDVWNEEIGLSRVITELDVPCISPAHDIYDVPLTPPVDASFSPGPILESTASSALSFNIVETTTPLDQGDCSNDTHGELYNAHNPPRPQSVQPKRISISHRISYNGSSSAHNPKLASTLLTSAYDEFLGVLGSFIGLHLQSRSSTELLLTTQKATQSCRTLLTIVGTICERDIHRSDLLEQSKNTLYDRITELVHATRDVFRPAHATDDEVVFMPDEGKRLVDAATGCVRGAGDCVAKARYVFEQSGDFELESIGLGITGLDTDNHESLTDNRYIDDSEVRNADDQLENVHDSNQVSMRSPLPPILIPTKQLPFTPDLSDGATPSSEYTNTMAETPTSVLDEQLDLNLSSYHHIADTHAPSEQCDTFGAYHATSPEDDHSSNMCHAETTADLSSTYVNSIRDSEASTVSQASTRVNSPDFNKPFPPVVAQSSFQGFQSPLIEEGDEGENLLEKTYAQELMFKDGQVIGGSLRALIEKLTAHQSTPDALFVSTFYLTFRHFATPTDFAEALMDRYDYIGDNTEAAGPVRLRVYNIFKGWLESHWRHDCDDVALPSILKFARTTLTRTLSSAATRLEDLAEKVSTLHGPVVPRLVSSMGKTNTAVGQYVSPDVPLPTPIISKSQLNLLKQWRGGGQSITILDFDALELARQFTLKESRIFCSILPEELLGTEWMKKSGSLAVNVRAMSTLSTDLANLVADCILQQEEPKKRAVVVKQWVKVASKCLELNNYDSLMAIICSLNSSTISRLRRTWELVSHKTKILLEQLREIVDVSRNYAVLRQRLQGHVPPCLPFVGTYLTDLTFVDHGNQDTRALPTGDGSKLVINFDKHMKTAKIISELQRFQIPYRLAEVPELQTWIQDQLIRVRSAGEKSFQNYYRRSLALEPREQSLQRSSARETNSALARETPKEKFDFLSWTHSSKSKTVTSQG
ncbi:ras guanine-nucleotide exchange protein Cdc25p [Histoplasma capsulatum G186AR]|uniref:Ras guanine-nucleotide exchange protein Cdc25p n=2 Tax=Ajellomyces capsulatus TaxID=5037 RepID=C0NIL4_AJECG|nr:ras guanine-nucleotide exchange protein Cdc25p [Histoplasma capsulatum G186AR]EEH08734.1 ras guanine-nucleotide exchange protein Cdc25p [Histoplasma capsulatum G186AR]KAG5303956.1 ras guanine-nucleotide exchange protein Cdc25p [Histoplasma capsulatum]QSS69554.1 ras guanine-nucleotide exchange protein Cdc25p [Histoplasma capsulatum G186AR]